MGQKISIDPDKLAAEITSLRAVREQSVADTTTALTSKGQAATVASGFASSLTDLDGALNALIDATIDFLTNIQDGFVDIDQAAAAAFTQFQAEVA